MKPLLQSRRALVGALGSLAACQVLARNVATRAAAVRETIPQQPRCRVIVDNDFAGDPDGLVALAHQLLSRTTRVTLITSSPVNPRFAPAGVAGHGCALGATYARELLDLVRARQPTDVVAGPESIDVAEADDRAARAIVQEAMREDSLPLFFTCGGPLTNLARALRLEPRIASRMTVIWIGGGDWPQGGWEYNLMTDPGAAREVIESSTVPLWQVPQGAYRQMQYSIARWTQLSASGSAIARWLYAKFTHPPEWAKIGGTWPLGDSPLVLLTALTGDSSCSVTRTARAIGGNGEYGLEVLGRSLRVYESLDARLTFDDMEAVFSGGNPAPQQVAEARTQVSSATSPKREMSGPESLAHGKHQGITYFRPD